MGHRRGAFLALGKGLLDFLDLGALEMTDLDGEFLERARNDRQGSKKKGVPIALDDLVSDRLRLEPGLPAHVGFDLGRNLGEGANRAGNFTDANLLDGPLQARRIPGHLLVPEGQLETEGDGLRMDAMGAPDHRLFLVPEG